MKALTGGDKKKEEAPKATAFLQQESQDYDYTVVGQPRIAASYAHPLVPGLTAYHPGVAPFYNPYTFGAPPIACGPSVAFMIPM